MQPLLQPPKLACTSFAKSFKTPKDITGILVLFYVVIIKKMWRTHSKPKSPMAFPLVVLFLLESFSTFKKSSQIVVDPSSISTGAGRGFTEITGKK